MRNATMQQSTADGESLPPTALPFTRVRIGARVEAAGEFLTHFGLVLVLAWIGAMKFTAYEALSIEPLVSNSPLMGWVYGVWSVRGFSVVLGLVELAIAVLIALETVSARLTALGSAMAVGMFLTTLTFLFSTPGWEPSLGGFPALAVVPGQFLLKDVVLLGASARALGRSLQALR